MSLELASKSVARKGLEVVVAVDLSGGAASRELADFLLADREALVGRPWRTEQFFRY